MVRPNSKRSMGVIKLTASPNTAAEASFTLTVLSRPHRLPVEQKHFTLSLPRLIHRPDAVAASVADILHYLPQHYLGIHIHTNFMPHLSDFFLEAAEYCNSNDGQGVRIYIEAHLTYYSAKQRANMTLIFDSDDLSLATSGSAIAALERVKIGDVGNMNCTICFEDYVEMEEEEERTEGTEMELALARMPCSHVFHYLCIVKWLETNKNCPLCRHTMCDWSS